MRQSCVDDLVGRSSGGGRWGGAAQFSSAKMHRLTGVLRTARAQLVPAMRSIRAMRPIRAPCTPLAGLTSQAPLIPTAVTPALSRGAGGAGGRGDQEGGRRRRALRSCGGNPRAFARLVHGGDA